VKALPHSRHEDFQRAEEEIWVMEKNSGKICLDELVLQKLGALFLSAFG